MRRTYRVMKLVCVTSNEQYEKNIFFSTSFCLQYDDDGKCNPAG